MRYHKSKTVAEARVHLQVLEPLVVDLQAVAAMGQGPQVYVAQVLLFIVQLQCRGSSDQAPSAPRQCME